jgi:hypothetical protein
MSQYIPSVQLLYANKKLKQLEYKKQKRGRQRKITQTRQKRRKKYDPGSPYWSDVAISQGTSTATGS